MYFAIYLQKNTLQSFAHTTLTPEAKMSGSAILNELLPAPEDASQHVETILSVGDINKFVKLDTLNTQSLKYIKLDRGLGDQFESTGWGNTPVAFTPHDPFHPARTDPGRIAPPHYDPDTGSLHSLMPIGSSTAAPAIPTHHFAQAWIVQGSSFPFNAPPPICTGPFVAQLLSDPEGNAAMRIIITPECEAAVEYVETQGTSSLEYCGANNGTVFLANPGHPWTVYEVSTMTIVMASLASGDTHKSDRFVYISRGVLGLVYQGDVNGIVKNIPLSNTTPALMRISNQRGYGGLALVGERRFVRVWDHGLGPAPGIPVDEFDATPVNKPLTTEEAPKLIEEFLRLNRFSATGNLKIYAKVTQDLGVTNPPRRWSTANRAVAWSSNQPTLTSIANGPIDIPTGFDPNLFAVAGASFSANYGFTGSTGFTTELSNFTFTANQQMEVTYFIAEPNNISAPIEDVPVFAVITLGYAHSGTRSEVYIRTGTVWVPPSSGVPNTNLAPMQLALSSGIDVPDFLNAHTTSDDSTTTSIAYPVSSTGVYGSNFASTSCIAGAKRVLHDFVGTVDGMAQINFRVRRSDVYLPTIAGAGQKRLLMWEPLMDSADNPDVVTIARPNGYKIVELVLIDTRVNGIDKGEYVYSRKLHSLKTAATQSSVYAQYNDAGTPLITSAEVLNITAALRTEFLEPTEGTDSSLWRGTKLKPTSGVTDEYRINYSISDWGRQIYRYARYVEMIARNKTPPFTATDFADLTTNANDAASIVTSNIAEACSKIWLGVKHALTDGLIPHFPARDSEIGMDVIYAGQDGPANGEVSVTDLREFLRLNDILEPDSVATMFNNLTAPINSILDVGLLTSEKIATIVGSPENLALDLHVQLTTGRLTELSVLARTAEDPYKFMDEVARFSRLRYDRAMCEDEPAHTRCIYGGLTHRFQRAIDEWAVICDPSGVPITDLSGMTDLNCIRLRHIPAPATGAPEYRLSSDENFSYYNAHHRQMGYLFYATAVAIKYSGNTTIATEVTKLLTETTDASPQATSSDCGTVAEPFPLMLALLDVLAPPATNDVTFTDNEPRNCVGISAPIPSYEAYAGRHIWRNFPPHRCFDVYAGHSWNPGPTGLPYRTIEQDTSGEAVLGYLGAYRLIQQFIAFHTKNGSAGPIASIRGYLTDNDKMPVVAYVALASEVSASEMYRSSRILEGAAARARKITTGSFNTIALNAGQSGGGNPVVTSELLLNHLIHRFTGMTTPLGCARSVRHLGTTPEEQNYPGALIRQLGSHLVPITDMHTQINDPFWRSIVAGGDFFGTNIPLTTVPMTQRLWAAGGALRREAGSGEISTLTKLLNHVVDTADTNSEIVAWCRMVATALSIKLTNISVAYPPTAHPATLPNFYLPQSSYYDVLFWMRLHGMDITV